MPSIDWIAVLVAAVFAFILGGLWYSPMMFAKSWMAETGLSEEQLAAASKGKIFGVSFVLAVVSAAVFAMFLPPDVTVQFGLGAGFAAGLFWVAASFGINYLFELKSLKLWLINGGYHTLQFTLYGLIFGLM